eukprot:2548589-Pyramimonas_sp.AAC.1
MRAQRLGPAVGFPVGPRNLRGVRKIWAGWTRANAATGALSGDPSGATKRVPNTRHRHWSLRWRS